MEESPRSRCIFMTKHTAGMCGVGKFMMKWKERDNPNCPRCGQFEDAPHVWKCTGCDANLVWKKSLEQLSDWLSSVQTDPDVQDAIIAYLNSWREDSIPEKVVSFDLKDIVQYQSNQGWRLVFEGWIPIAWDEIQQAYYNLIKSRRTGKRWTICLIKKLWDIAWDLWDHRNDATSFGEHIGNSRTEAARSTDQDDLFESVSCQYDTTRQVSYSTPIESTATERFYI
jgi:hypothetical protein